MIEKDKVDYFLMTHMKYFPSDKMIYIKEKLSSIDSARYSLLMGLDLIDPTTTLLISIFLGELGIDRFMLGDVGLGIFKLLTLGGCGIMAIVDWFIVGNRAKEKNFQKLMTFI